MAIIWELASLFEAIFETTCIPYFVTLEQFSVHLTHNEIMPMQYTEIFKVVKNENFQ